MCKSTATYTSPGLFHNPPSLECCSLETESSFSIHLLTVLTCWKSIPEEPLSQILMDALFSCAMPHAGSFWHSLSCSLQPHSTSCCSSSTHTPTVQETPTADCSAASHFSPLQSVSTKQSQTQASNDQSCLFHSLQFAQ